MNYLVSDTLELRLRRGVTYGDSNGDHSVEALPVDWRIDPEKQERSSEYHL
jgi:hypothetical protein